MTYFFILMIASVLFIAGYREIICKIEAEEQPTHYVRFDMKDLSFTVKEYNKLKAQGENLSSFEPAIRMKDGSFRRACLASLKAA